MPIKLECPRCRQSLAVPHKKAGTYVSCPRCAGRLWVPKEGTGEEDAASDGSSAMPAVPVAAPPATGSPAAAPPVGSPPIARPAAPPTRGPQPAVTRATFIPPAAPYAPPPAAPLAMPGAPAAPASAAQPAPAAPVAPVQSSFTWNATAPAPIASKKTAKFITADATESNIHPLADGKLPELALNEGQQADKAEKGGRTVSPLVLMLVLASSVVMSIMIVVVDWGPIGAGNSQIKAEARARIRADYFDNMDRNTPLAPYQIYLRDAQQAHSRGEFRTERELYRKVLDLLKAERSPLARGVTGSQSRDKTLERYVTTLLREE